MGCEEAEALTDYMEVARIDGSRLNEFYVEADALIARRKRLKEGLK